MRRRTFLRAGAATLAAGAGASVVAGGDAPDASAASVAAAQSGYEPLGRVPIADAKDAVVGDDGTTVYVAATDGFAVADVSDPAAPAVIAERRNLLANREDGPLRQLWEVQLDGDRLIAVGPANALSDAVYGVLLYDVGDPAEPERVDFYETSFPIHNAFFEDGVVYLTATGIEGNPMVVLDARDDELERIGSWTIHQHDADWSAVYERLYPIHDVYVQDGLAYVSYWDAGAWILDVSDPSEPTYVTHLDGYDYEELRGMDAERATYEPLVPEGNVHYCQVSDDGTLLGVGKEAWEYDLDGDRIGGPGGIDLWDVSDPDDPEHLSRIAPPASDDNTQEGLMTTAHNFDLVGDRLYSSWYFGGVKLHDVSDPAAPEELAWWRDPEAASFWTARAARPGTFFVASSAAGAGEMDLAPEAALYTFPEHDDEQSDPPSLGQSDDADSGDGSNSNSDDAPREGSSGTDDDPIPGFGVGAALTGIGASAAARYRRRR